MGLALQQLRGGQGTDTGSASREGLPPRAETPAAARGESRSRQECHPQDRHSSPLEAQTQHLPRCITRRTCANPRASSRNSALNHRQKHAPTAQSPTRRDQSGPASTGLHRRQAHPSSLRTRRSREGFCRAEGSRVPLGKAVTKGVPGQSLEGPSPSACTAAARFTRWSASSMASAGPRGSSRDSPITRMRMSVSSRMGTSEQRRRKKLWAEQAGLGLAGAARAHVQKPQL